MRLVLVFVADDVERHVIIFVRLLDELYRCPGVGSQDTTPVDLNKAIAGFEPRRGCSAPGLYATHPRRTTSCDRNAKAVAGGLRNGERQRLQLLHFSALLNTVCIQV